MNDQELTDRLKSVRVPARSAEYWEDFPGAVRRQLDSAPVSSERARPLLPRLAWAGGLAYACFVFVVMPGPVHTMLKTEKCFRHELAQLPAHLKMFMADEHGLHYLVTEKE